MAPRYWYHHPHFTDKETKAQCGHLSEVLGLFPVLPFPCTRGWDSFLPPSMSPTSWMMQMGFVGIDLPLHPFRPWLLRKPIPSPKVTQQP